MSLYWLGVVEQGSLWEGQAQAWASEIKPGLAGPSRAHCQYSSVQHISCHHSAAGWVERGGSCFDLVSVLVVEVRELVFVAHMS